MNSFLLAGQLFLLASAPTGHTNQLWGYTWAVPAIEIPYDEAQGTLHCSDEAAAKGSACIMHISTRGINPNMLVAAPAVPKGATAALITLKTKIWLKETNRKMKYHYCQIDVTAAKDFEQLKTQNHSAHTEEWAPAGKERRRVSLNQIVVPLDETGSFVASIHRGIYGNCETEVLFTLVGYYK